jgi:hypothetical protein
MKAKRFEKFIFLGLVFSWALLSGCGNGGSNTMSLSSMFFPVQTGDVHNLQRTNAQGAMTSFIQTVDPAMVFNGNMVHPFTTRDGSGNIVHTDYYGTDTSMGVNICGWDDFENDFMARYTPCMFLPALMEGDSVSGSAAVQGGGNFSTAARMEFIMTVEDFGTVQVPAGTFMGCGTSKLEVTHFDASGDILEQGMFRITLCPNVGFVQISHQGLSIGSATTKLVSGTAGGNPI